ncbi:unnamed protein product [Larinioides sclopetarius]|uniref:Uncharacterized protein n=1 Tax=Larinioides sclopetarius TaxID=280406 RepID=A0AAV2AYB5_9ARAC
MCGITRNDMTPTIVSRTSHSTGHRKGLLRTLSRSFDVRLRPVLTDQTAPTVGGIDSKLKYISFGVNNCDTRFHCTSSGSSGSSAPDLRHGSCFWSVLGGFCFFCVVSRGGAATDTCGRPGFTRNWAGRDCPLSDWFGRGISSRPGSDDRPHVRHLLFLHQRTALRRARR